MRKQTARSSMPTGMHAAFPRVPAYLQYQSTHVLATCPAVASCKTADLQKRPKVHAASSCCLKELQETRDAAVTEHKASHAASHVYATSKHVVSAWCSVCRACRIKNQPVANKQLLLEEDLLPLMPANSSTCTMSVTQMQVRFCVGCSTARHTEKVYCKRSHVDMLDVRGSRTYPVAVTCGAIATLAAFHLPWALYNLCFG